MVKETVSIPEHEWKAVFEESLEYFRDLLRFDTTSPPGNERQACEYLGAVLAREQVDYEILYRGLVHCPRNALVRICRSDVGT